MGKHWPESPYRYPLTGPSRGHVYAPPHDAKPTLTFWDFVKFCAKAAFIGFVAFWAYGFFEYFFIPN